VIFGILTMKTTGGILGYGNGISNSLFYGAVGYGICALINKESIRLWHSLLLIITGLVLQLFINFFYLSMLPE